MDPTTKAQYLKIALIVSGIAFLLVYPLSIIWPSSEVGMAISPSRTSETP